MESTTSIATTTWFFFSFCIWNAAHHFEYVFTTNDIPLHISALRGFIDLLGNIWRHFVVQQLIPMYYGESVEISWLLYLNYAHIFFHTLGTVTYFVSPNTLKDHMREFQTRRMKGVAYWFDWIIEVNDSAYYLWLAALLVPLMNPLVCMAQIMVWIGILFDCKWIYLHNSTAKYE